MGTASRDRQLALSLPRKLKDAPASAGLRMHMSLIDTRRVGKYLECGEL